MGVNRFQKGNQYGIKFSSTNQPSREKKSEGWKKARMVKTSMVDLLGGVEPDDKAAALVMTLLPKKTRKKVFVQDVINLRQILEAKKGNPKAYANILNLLAQIENQHLQEKDDLIISPLDYIAAGRKAKEEGRIHEVTDAKSLEEAIFSYLGFMHDKRMSIFASRDGDVSLPQLEETFRLYAGVTHSQWDALGAQADCIPLLDLLQDAINAQRKEGALLGIYSARVSAGVVRAENTSTAAPNLALDPITGMEVL